MNNELKKLRLNVVNSHNLLKFHKGTQQNHKTIHQIWGLHPQFFTGGGEGFGGENDPEAIHNLCLILKSVL